MATQSSTTNGRTEPRRARPLIELGVVVVLSISFYWASARFDLFERLDHGLDLHGRFEVDDALLALPVALLMLAVYAWRRNLEAQATSAAAVAAEKELARTTEEFRSLFDYHPHAVFAIDPQRRYQRLNPAAEALSGYTEEEMLPRVFPSLKTQDGDRVLAAFDRALEREPQRLRAALDRRDGERRDVDLTLVPIVVMDNTVGVYVIAADVTEEERMRRALTQALVDADQANEAKRVLIGNVSHQLRTPLTSVIAAAEILEDSELDALQRRMAGMISRNGEALRRMVDDLLDLTRMEAGELRVDSVPFDLHTVLDETVAHLSPAARTKGLRMAVEVDPLPGRVIGDPLRLRQVLTNLLGNAVKFTETGEVGLALDWKRQEDESLETVFRVWDTGIGMAVEDQERLFEHFEQADSSCTSQDGGVGLGLPISRRLVELMSGALSVESEPGAGSTFTVRLALDLADVG